MTVIVGIEDRDKGRVIIGGDSAGVSGWSIQTRADSKVFVRRAHGVAWAFGFAGSFRLGNLLRYVVELPAPPDPAVDIDAFMVREFIPCVRKALKDNGAARVEHSVEEAEGSFLVGVFGRLYYVGADFQVGHLAHGQTAIGCGRDEARGALAALTSGQAVHYQAWRRGRGSRALTPRDVVEVALATTAELNGGVCAPFAVVEAAA